MAVKRMKKASRLKTPTLTERRGVDNFDYNYSAVFVETDPDQVADELQRLRKGAAMIDVINEEIELSHQCFFVFRLVGHTWSQIVARDPRVDLKDPAINPFMPGFDKIDVKALRKKVSDSEKLCLNDTDAEKLGRKLKTRAVFYRIGELGAYVDFNIHEAGKKVEITKMDDGEISYQVRGKKAPTKEIEKDREGWLDRRFRELDLFEPCIVFDNLSGRDRLDIVHEIERLNFVSL